MARIRTIKPEFPQSETMGRLSRDARLLFIQLWTIADDEGRARASSRMLASLLYPYDDDARDLMEGWLGELEREQCIRRYEAEGATYLEIVNWLKHQKIDRPTKSRLPEFDESSRALDEPSSTDLGPGPGPRTNTSSLRSDVCADAPKQKRKSKAPLPAEWKPNERHHEIASQLGVNLPDQEERFRDYLASNHKLYDDYDAAFRNFLKNAPRFSGAANGPGRPRAFQDDRLSVSKANERLRQELERGTVQFPPRPSLVHDEGQGNLRLLPKG